MGLFKESKNTTAFAKVGILGFAGSGKTRTASEIAIGLHKALKSKKPVTFLDTETGSDFMIPLFEKNGIKLLVSKTRSFKDLAEGQREAPTLSDILLVDSISHFWVDLVESYRRKKNVNRLTFQDWGILKPMWRDDFSTPFVSSPIHIIVCGRAGFEYDYFEGEDGKMELYKTGTKMKAEGEFGFEPSLLIEMERIKNPEATEQYRQAKTKDAKMKAAKAIAQERAFVRIATVIKDRSDIMDGMTFTNPSYSDFAPHWEAINIGGVHHPLEAGDSTSLFDNEGKPEWKKNKEKAQILLEEIEGQMVRMFPGSSAKEKKAKGDLVDHVFQTRSWTKVQLLSVEELQAGLERIKEILAIPDNILVLQGELDEPIRESSQGHRDTDKKPCPNDPENELSFGYCRENCKSFTGCPAWE
jgi:hypothetical protein